MISTIIGTANFAQDRFPEEYKEYVVMWNLGLYQLLLV